MSTERIEYRPNVFLGLAFAAIFAVTAVILIWLGMILGPADRAAMDGATLLLLTAVPIPLFSWTAAAVFMFLGFRIARRTLRGEPTLVISKENLTLPTGRSVPWARIRSVKAHQNDHLLIEVVDEQTHANTPSARPKWIGRLRHARDQNQVLMSSFDLGASPAAVATELESRKAEALREEDLV